MRRFKTCTPRPNTNSRATTNDENEAEVVVSRGGLDVRRLLTKPLASYGCT